MASAFIGQPPNTQEDYYIARGILRKFGFVHQHPAQGAYLPPSRPLDDQYHSHVPRLLAGYSVAVVLIVFISGTRVLVRALSRGLRWGWDDWLIILATLTVLAWFSGAFVMVSIGGGGKHIWDVTYHQYNHFNKAGVVNQLFYLPSAVLIKMSIVIFNRRITGMASKTWRWINDAFLTLLILFAIAISVWVGTRCRDSTKSFLQIGQATNYVSCNRWVVLQLSFGLATIHVVLGFCLLLTPIIVLWKIKVDWKKKSPLFGIFAMGSVSCVSALMIVVSHNQIHDDVTWKYIDLNIWIQLDLLFGIIVASAPVLYGQMPKTWSMIKSHRLSRSHRSGSHNHGEVKSGRKGDEGKMYRHDNVEACQSDSFRVDDQVELLEPPRRLHLAGAEGHHETDGGEFMKEAGRQESENSTAPPSVQMKS